MSNSAAQVVSEATRSQTPVYNTNVSELYKVVLKTFKQQTHDWISRNIFVKSWLLQDFRKNAEMTVDEMDDALNDLGEKIKQQEPTTDCIAPLGQLVKYYQHQLDEMKGYQRLSHKQAESVEKINSWIGSVKDLIEALKEKN